MKDEVENWEVNLAILKLPVAHVLSKQEAIRRITKLSEVEVQLRSKASQKKSFDSDRYRYSDRIDYTSTSGLQKSIALFERKAREQEQEITRLRRSTSKSSIDKPKGVASSSNTIARTPKSKSPRPKESNKELSIEAVSGRSKSSSAATTKSKIRPGSEIRAPTVNVKSVNENIFSGLPTKPSSQKSPRKKSKESNSTSKSKDKTSSESSGKLKSEKNKKDDKATPRVESTAPASEKSAGETQIQPQLLPTTEEKTITAPDSTENQTATQKIEKEVETIEKPEETAKKVEEPEKEQPKTEETQKTEEKPEQKVEIIEKAEEKPTAESEKVVEPVEQQIAEKGEEKSLSTETQEGGNATKLSDKFEAIILEDKEEIFKLLEEIVEKEGTFEEGGKEKAPIEETKEQTQEVNKKESKEATNSASKGQSSENTEKKSSGSGISGRLRSISREVVEVATIESKKSNKKEKKEKKSLITSPNFSGKRKNEDKKKQEKNFDVDTAAVQIRPLNTKQKLKNLFGKRKSTTDPLKSASADIQAQIQQIQKAEIRSASLDIEKEKAEETEELNKEIVLNSFPFVNENEISNDTNQILLKEDSLGNTPSSSQASLPTSPTASQDSLFSNMFQSPPNSPGVFATPPAPFQSNQLPTPEDLPPTEVPLPSPSSGDSLLKNQQIQSLLHSSGNSVPVSSAPSSPPQSSTSPAGQSSPPQPSLENNESDALDANPSEKRKGAHRRHISSGDVSTFTMPSANSVNLDVAFILSRIIIPVRTNPSSFPLFSPLPFPSLSSFLFPLSSIPPPLTSFHLLLFLHFFFPGK